MQVPILIHMACLAGMSHKETQQPCLRPHVCGVAYVCLLCVCVYVSHSSSHGGSGAAGGATLDDPASLVWTWCTPLMRLVIAACVCNKARFVVEGDDDKDKEQGKKGE